VRTTISCNSGLVSVNFSCTILDHFINSFGITMLVELVIMVPFVMILAESSTKKMIDL
jgi:hypothetical protein